MSGFGGFPSPFELIRMAIDRFFPKASMKVTRTMTMPRTNSIAGRGTINSGMAEETKEVPYISFSAVVGRNSRFHDLTEEQMDELGGVEYRGLRVLLYIVSGVCFTFLSMTDTDVQYFIFLQLAAFVIIAPYIDAGKRYQDVFDAQPKHVSTTWFSLFNAVSAFTNTGTSLSDASLVPFQTAYLMNFSKSIAGVG
jgi:Trk-type K+ transport system membrane component